MERLREARCASGGRRFLAWLPAAPAGQRRRENSTVVGNLLPTSVLAVLRQLLDMADAHGGYQLFFCPCAGNASGLSTWRRDSLGGEFAAAHAEGNADPTIRIASQGKIRQHGGALRLRTEPGNTVFSLVF